VASSPARFANLVRRYGQVTAYGVAALFFAIAYANREPYDDAHFFKRVAVNALEHGTLAWNVDEGPVYGSTSQVFQLLAVGVSAFTRNHYMLVMRALSLSFTVAAFAVLRRLTLRRDEGLSAILAFGSATLLFPILSGMETALGVLGVTVFLWLLYADASRERHGLLAPLLVLGVYLTRPDAALLCVVPLVIEGWSRRGRPPWRELAWIAALLTGALLLLRWYYGTALPLPFYAKQAALSPYDASFVELSNRVGRQRFGLFAGCALST
jgi:hypothetical protein